MSSTWWAKKLGVEPPNAPQYQSSSVRPAPPTLPSYQPSPVTSPSTPITMENFADATHAWQGGAATRTESQPCPNCHGNLFFSRSNGGSAVAPRCYTCGYTQGRPMQGMPL